MAATEGGAGGPITIGSPITSYICFDKEEIENILFVGYQSSQFLKSRNIIEKAKESEA